MREVFDALGTVVSLEAPALSPSTLDAVHAVFGNIDARFSLYRSDSELARVAAGDLRLSDTSDEVRDTYARAQRWTAATAGAFTVHRPDGVLDFDGIAKALAIDEVGAILERSGATPWSVTVGGDVLVSAIPFGADLVAGVVNPVDRSRLLCAVALSGPRRAIATSGSAERGEHIWRLPGRETDLIHVTVVANDIVTADVLATAGIAGGPDLLDVLTGSADIDLLAVDRGGAITATAGFRAALRHPNGIVAAS